MGTPMSGAERVGRLQERHKIATERSVKEVDFANNSIVYSEYKDCDGNITTVAPPSGCNWSELSPANEINRRPSSHSCRSMSAQIVLRNGDRLYGVTNVLTDLDPFQNVDFISSHQMEVTSIVVRGSRHCIADGGHWPFTVAGDQNYKGLRARAPYIQNKNKVEGDQFFCFVVTETGLAVKSAQGLRSNRSLLM
ncbi:hypothetical protein EVAR_53951_1 [Eumeta japonica]|uniref:Uncharacterized protein n=1 Tax=Eumeta variegata TaxID=151549 RepID=A0A4C1Y0N5_EUMVA|nr:hypothetical protein EVAR_53951_1 [Eumeta japonica]